MIAPEQGETKKLRQTYTIPIVCDPGVKTCALSVDVGQSNEQGEAGQTQVLEVTGKPDFVDDGDKTMLLKLNIPINIDLSDWNNYTTIPNIKVR